jgi:hypothetical protein
MRGGYREIALTLGQIVFGSHETPLARLDVPQHCSKFFFKTCVFVDAPLHQSLALCVAQPPLFRKRAHQRIFLGL